MIEDHISAIVEAHYATQDADILLLSRLGEQLVKDGHWPLERGDKRTLFDVVSGIAGIVVISDPQAKAFITVVRAGDEQRAHDAIALSKKLFFLRGLPRPVLLAFTLEVAQGQPMHLALEPKAEYRGGPGIDDPNFHLVDDDLRLPGLDVSNLETMPAEDRDRLDANIREWAQRHALDLSNQARRVKRTELASRPQATTALERLYAAQTSEIAKKLTIPIDIALALSRMA